MGTFKPNARTIPTVEPIIDRSNPMENQNWVEHCLRCGWQSILSLHAEGHCRHCILLQARKPTIDPQLPKDAWRIYPSGNPKMNQLGLSWGQNNDAMFSRQRPLSGRGLLEGVWDGLHIGTVTRLISASQKCNSLVVGLYSDVSTVEATQLAPIFTLEERRKLISSVRDVDRIIYNIPFDAEAAKFVKVKCDFLMIPGKTNHPSSSDYATTHPFARNKQKRYESMKQDENHHIFSQFHSMMKTGEIREVISDIYADIGDSLILIHLYKLAWKNSTLITKNTAYQGAFDSKKDRFSLQATWASLRRRDATSRPMISSRTIKAHRKSTNEQKDEHEFDSPPCHKMSEPEEDDEVVVYLDGAFDILHVGHIDLIEAARTRFNATKLVIGILSDEAIYKVSDELPCFSMLERAAVVESLRGVDEVIYDVPWVLRADMLREFSIDIVLQRLELYPKCGYGFKIQYLRSEDIYRAAVHDLGIRVDKCAISMSTSDIFMRVLKQHDVICQGFKDFEALQAEIKTGKSARIIQLLESVVHATEQN